MGKRKRVLEATMEIKRINKAQNDSDKVFSSSSFSSLGLNPTLCDQLKERMGFESPTHIQAQAIPVILSGRHVLVNAATGTGKTVVYLAPIIHHLQNYNNRIQRNDGTFGLTDLFHSYVTYIFICTFTHRIGCESDNAESCIFKIRLLLSSSKGNITSIFHISFMKVYEILQKLLHRFHWIVPGYLMGGENRSKEKARLRKGISILVATPGRLLDHLRHTESFVYTNLRWIIFDEADSILELGFGKDIEEILDLLGSRGSKNNSKGNKISKISQFERQNVLLSATLNEKVNNLAKISLEKPMLIGLDDKASSPNDRLLTLGSNSEKEADNLGKEEIISTGDYNVPAQLFQRYIKVPCGSRLVVLLSVLKDLFKKDPSNKIVVFFSTCDAVDFHFTLLGEFKGLSKKQDSEFQNKLFLSCKTFRLHGSMKHDERRTSFQAFKAEESALLLSTDVSARGLDFPRVKCIIQYDSPGEATEYVHRVGRTARLGEKGDSLLFLQPVETDYLQELEKHGVSLTAYPLVENHPYVVSLQKELESCVAKPPLMKLAKDAFCSWVRAYTAHRGELKRIFMVKKLHLGHVAKSFALKEQPTLVGKSFQNQSKKRKRDEKRKGPYKKAITRKS